MNKSKLTYCLSILMLIIGVLQMAGYVLKNPVLRGLGFSYGASPLPTVFGTVKGVEGFSTQHTINFTYEDGATDSIQLDKKVFNRFNGSYLLKNAYSIFLAYPHVLKPSQVENGITFLLNKENLQNQFFIKGAFRNTKLSTRRIMNGQSEIKYYTPISR